MQSKQLLFFVLILAVCLTQVASDIYTPSLPAIAQNLKASLSLVQLSMAIYMLGVAVSQLVYGPISEGVGRKLPLTIGLFIMLAGSLFCTFAPTIHLLILGRLIQGLGAGACASLWRSVFRDVYTGEDLAKYGSYLVIFVMFIVPASPVLGGYLQNYFGWRASFIFMSLYTGIAIIAIILGFTETSVHHHKEKLKLSYVRSSYLLLLKNKIFMGVTACTFLCYGAFFAWFVAGPVLLIERVGLSPVAFGWITFFGGGTAYALAGWVNGKIVKKVGIPTLMRSGFLLMILSAILLLLGQWRYGVEATAIIIPIILFYFGTTFIWPNAFATAFTPFGHIAGYAGSLYGFMQIGGAALIGGIISHLPTNDQFPLALLILTCSCAAWICYEIIFLSPTKKFS